MNVTVGDVKLLNCEVSVDGPDTTDQAGVPTVGAFAPRVAAVVKHSVWSAPAFAGVAAWLTVTVAVFAVETAAVHPFPSVTELNVYTVVVPGDTEIVCGVPV